MLKSDLMGFSELKFRRLYFYSVSVILRQTLGDMSTGNRHKQTAEWKKKQWSSDLDDLRCWKLEKHRTNTHILLHVHTPYVCSGLDSDFFLGDQIEQLCSL